MKYFSGIYLQYQRLKNSLDRKFSWLLYYYYVYLVFYRIIITDAKLRKSHFNSVAG